MMKRWIVDVALVVWSKIGWPEKIILMWVFLPTLHNAQNYLFQNRISEGFNAAEFKRQILNEVKAERNAWAAPLFKEEDEKISSLKTDIAVIKSEMKNVSEKVQFMYENGFTYRPRK